ncbi:NAD(P)/FAD-dependent oxidoreductase [Georgenia faecalis]|uniref:NAD(P)/FAD-dependent oxidoreductase n=1 Tax=Georgenia faecalis TaxID=2483799 RepID=A0ABV9D845_9MICO|nr:NAD(P)/FAD-dependent oxidoreductase [Georgenia faecalis]
MRNQTGTNADRVDVVVVGGGAAGLSAALMLGRARRRVVVVDAGSPRNRFAAHMHGVLGHEGTPPAELAARGRAEAAGYGVRFVDDVAARVDDTGDGVRVTLGDGGAVDGRVAILAAGVSDDLPDIPGLAERWGRTVLHCPYCHGWEVRGQRLGVLAISPASVHQAQLVRQWSDDVVLFSAGAGPLPAETVERLRARGIRLVDEPVVEVLADGDAVTGVRTADGRLVEVGAVFTGGTLRPHDAMVAHLDLARADGPGPSVLAVDPTGRTSNPRIWAVGNVRDPMANVPLVIGAGAMAGAVVNMALVEQEFDDAVAAAPSLGVA